MTRARDLADSADLSFDGSTLNIDTVNDRVGIGTTSPLSGLHISDGTNAGSPQNTNRKATLMIDAGATASADLQFMVRSGYNSHIFFGDAADPNIGMLWYNHTENSMNFLTNTATAMTIDVDQKVGIGTTNPDQKMHLYTSSGTTLYKAEVNANSTVGLEIKKTGSTTQSWQIADGITHNGALQFYDVTDTAVRMHIDGSGNVGIGTTSPSQKLDVNGNVFISPDTAGKDTFRLTTNAANDASLLMKSDTTTKVHIQANGDSYFNGGNVGINTTAPGSRRLKIVGSSSNYPLALDSTNTDYALEFQKNGVSEWWIAASASSFKIHENGVGDRFTVTSDGDVGIGTNNPGGPRLYVQDTHTATVTDATSLIANTTLAINGNSSQGSDVMRMGPMGTAGRYFIDVSNSAGSGAYDLLLNPIGGGNVGIGETSPENILHIKTSTAGGPQIELDSTSGTANSAFINFDGTSLQLATQRDMVDGSKRDTAKSWGGINIVGPAAGSYIQLQTSSGNNNAVSTRMTVDKDGNVTTPSQPSCSIYNCGFGSSATSWSSAGSGSANGGLVGVAHHNNGNHYSTSTGYFTAPAAGYYLCNLNVYGKKDNNHGDNAGYWWGYFQKNGGYYAGNYIMEAYYNSGDYDQGASISSIIYLSANDTVRPYCGSYIHGVSVYGPNTSFSCHLLG